MFLTREQCRAWQAMNVGPVWILRDEPGLQDAAPEGTPAAPSVQAGGQRAGEPVRPPRPSRTIREPARGETSGNVPAAGRPVPAQPAGVRQDPGIASLSPKASWKELEGLVRSCSACPMARTRNNTVFADGAPGCPVMIIGEAPGRDEDIEGIPFVGKSGKLLTAILGAVGMKRGTDVLICNVLKCRPPGNRDPRPDEVAACSCFLERQVELAAPKAMMLLGRHAVCALLHRDEPIARLRGRAWEVRAGGRTIPAVVSYHPSYLLRSPMEKEKSWHDFILLRRILSRPGNG